MRRFYKELQSLVDDVPRRDGLFIVGNFNGKVYEIVELSVVGTHSDVTRGHND